MTPDQLAKSGSEHGEQRALFAWANMAQRFGFAAAWDDRSYTVKGHAEATFSQPADGNRGVAALARLHAIPNGGLRDKITAGKLKAEGVKQGVPDIFLPLPLYLDWKHERPHNIVKYCGHYIELKRTKRDNQRGGTISPEQKDWVAYLRNVGYAVTVAFGWREAAKAIEHYINQCGGINEHSTNER